jgi:hypothetical protein
MKELMEVRVLELPTLSASSTEAAGLVHRQFYRRAYGTFNQLNHTVKFNLLSLKDV